MTYLQCSVTCGQGQRRRGVHCRYDDGRTSNECDEDARPQSIMDCVLRACPMWQEEPWGKVSTYIRDFLKETLKIIQVKEHLLQYAS